MVRDPQGRTRVFISDLSGTDDAWRPGVSIYDEGGSERVSLLLGDVVDRTARAPCWVPVPHVLGEGRRDGFGCPAGTGSKSIEVVEVPLVASSVHRGLCGLAWGHFSLGGR